MAEGEREQVRDLAELQKLHSSKWLRYASDVLPMHVAEMDFEVDPGVRTLLSEMVAKSDLGYLIRSRSHIKYNPESESGINIPNSRGDFGD